MVQEQVTKEVQFMDYEKCWNRLKGRLEKDIEKSESANTDWITVITVKALYDMMLDIERKVREND